MQDPAGSSSLGEGVMRLGQAWGLGLSLSCLQTWGRPALSPGRGQHSGGGWERGKDYPVFLGSGEKRTGSHFLLSPLQVGFQPHPFSGTILLLESHRPPSNSTSVNTAGAPLPGTLCIISFPDLKLLVVLPLGPPILPSLCPLHALPSPLGAPPKAQSLRL